MRWFCWYFYWKRCDLRRVTAILLQQKNFGPNVIYLAFGIGRRVSHPPRVQSEGFMRHDTKNKLPYVTFGPKFCCWSKMAVTRRRMHLNQSFLAGSPPLDVSYLSSLSKQDLKDFSNFDFLGFAGTYFSSILAPRRATKLRSLQCYLFV